jgi:diacylglycerol kinase family enzyme
VSLLRLLWLGVQIRTKAHTHSRSVELGKIQEIAVTAEQPLPIHVDGELVPELDSKARTMKVKVLPSALRIVIPSLCQIEIKAPEAIPAPAL